MLDNVYYRLNQIINIESSNDYNTFSIKEEFINLSKEFFEIYSKEFRYMKRWKSTIKDKIEYVNSQMVDIFYYEIRHYIIGVINIDGKDKIYSIKKDDYSKYKIHELIYDMYYERMIYNYDVNGKILKEGDTESKDISIILYDKIKNGEDKLYANEIHIINTGKYKDVNCFKYTSMYIGYIKDQSNNIFFIKEESLYSIYKKWRWLTYNQLSGKTSTIEDIIEGKLSNDNERLIPNKLIENYKNINFEISEELIEKFEQELQTKVEELKQNRTRTINLGGYWTRILGNGWSINSTFIENCFIDEKEFAEIDIIKRIKRNLIYYHWWDRLTFDELCSSIANGYFLRSTSELIGAEHLVEYFKSRFESKRDFIKHLLSNFTPKDWNIKEMKSPSRKTVMFSYEYLFRNEFLSSIRVFENECRFYFDERIIGAFYNEDLLFREVKKVFGDRYEVISQGTPEWLRPQRFDIYLPEINFAIEYQGEQHFMPVDFGGKGKKVATKQFEENQRRDKLKKEKSDANSCFLHYVYPSYYMEAVISELKKLIRQKEKNSDLINEQEGVELESPL